MPIVRQTGKKQQIKTHIKNSTNSLFNQLYKKSDELVASIISCSILEWRHLRLLKKHSVNLLVFYSFIIDILCWQPFNVQNWQSQGRLWLFFATVCSTHYGVFYRCCDEEVERWCSRSSSREPRSLVGCCCCWGLDRSGFGDGEKEKMKKIWKCDNLEQMKMRKVWKYDHPKNIERYDTMTGWWPDKDENEEGMKEWWPEHLKAAWFSPEERFSQIDTLFISGFILIMIRLRIKIRMIV